MHFSDLALIWLGGLVLEPGLRSARARRIRSQALDTVPGGGVEIETPVEGEQRCAICCRDGDEIGVSHLLVPHQAAKGAYGRRERREDLEVGVPGIGREACQEVEGLPGGPGDSDDGRIRRQADEAVTAASGREVARSHVCWRWRAGRGRAERGRGCHRLGSLGASR